MTIINIQRVLVYDRTSALLFIISLVGIVLALVGLFGLWYEINGSAELAALGLIIAVTFSICLFRYPIEYRYTVDTTNLGRDIPEIYKIIEQKDDHTYVIMFKED